MSVRSFEAQASMAGGREVSSSPVPDSSAEVSSSLVPRLSRLGPGAPLPDPRCASREEAGRPPDLRWGARAPRPGCARVVADDDARVVVGKEESKG
jgi:hypothetical protein